MRLTLMYDKKGKPVECCKECAAHAVREYYGHCPGCWAMLPREERAVLLGEELPPKQQVEVVHTTERYINPPNYWLRALVLAWGAVVTATMAWLTWKGR
jgi:predicted amidophosphoribosyltransferase